MPEIEEILNDKEIEAKKLLKMRTSALQSKIGAEVEKDVREYIKSKELDIEPSDTNDTKLLNREKQIEFETIIIDIIDKRLKKLND